MRTELEDKYYTELDKQLQQLALTDWVTFNKLIGADAIECAKICILRAQGNSLQQIANKLNVTKRKAQKTHENKCVCDIRNQIAKS